MSNQQILLTSYPPTIPDPSIWKFSDCDLPIVESSESIVVKSVYISVDPYLRGLIKSVPLNSTITSGIIGEVIESTSEKFKTGDFVVGYLPWRKYNVIKDTDVRLVNPNWGPLSTAIGILGMPGRTAYFGIVDILKPKENETVLISGAAGAVGLAVAQIIRAIYGESITLIGTCSSNKLNLLKEYGFNHAIDYTKLNTSNEALAALKAVAPKGIDSYFDNTGGFITEAVFDLLNKYGRVAICGQISMYNDAELPKVSAFLQKTIYKSVTIRGFLQSDFSDRDDEFYDIMPKLFQAGKLKYEETIMEGFESVPEAFLGLFKGKNTGKMVVKV